MSQPRAALAGEDVNILVNECAYFGPDLYGRREAPS